MRAGGSCAVGFIGTERQLTASEQHSASSAQSVVNPILTRRVHSAFGVFWGRYDGGPDAYLPALATAGRAMGTALDQYADTVHEAKRKLEEMAVVAGATVLVGTVLAVFTFGASEAAVGEITADLIAAAEALSLEVSADAADIVATVLADSAIAAAESTILDIAVAQPIRVLAFHDGGFSLTEVEQALTSGAEQGALRGLGRFMRHEPGPPGIVPGGPGTPGRRGGPELIYPPVPKWASTHLRDHIFLGHIKLKKLTGYHSRPGGEDTGSARIVPGTQHDRGKGVYEADYQQLDEHGNVERKPDGDAMIKSSTFFPDQWSPLQIEDAIGQSFDQYAHAAALQAPGGKFAGEVDGVKIEGYYRFNSKTSEFEVVTAYPSKHQ